MTSEEFTILSKKGFERLSELHYALSAMRIMKNPPLEQAVLQNVHETVDSLDKLALEYFGPVEDHIIVER